MFVDQRILEDLCRDAGATRKDKAIKYQKQGKVEIRKLDYKNIVFSMLLEVLNRCHNDSGKSVI